MQIHVITDFDSMDGAQTMLARILRDGAGSKVVVVSLNTVSDQARERIANPDIQFHALNIVGVSTAPAGLWKLARIIRRHRHATILCWMYHSAIFGLVAARLAGHRGRILWTVRQALDDTSSMGRGLRSAVHVAARLSRRCDGIVYNSERARSQHAAAGFDDRRSLVIPNGVEIPSAPDHSARQPRIFGIAARHNPQKDHPTFLAAAARLAREMPDARFIAVGPRMTPDNPELARQIRSAGLDPSRVDLRGPVSDISAFYTEIDVLVLSSRTEGFPNVVAEAMSFGRPVVTTDVGDASAIVGDTGTVVPPRDAGMLADAMRRMAHVSPEGYADLSRRATQRIRARYALPDVIAQYQSVMEDRKAAVSPARAPLEIR